MAGGGRHDHVGDLRLGKEGVTGEEGPSLAAQVGREAEQEETLEELLPRRPVQAAEEEAKSSHHGRPCLAPAALLLRVGSTGAQLHSLFPAVGA